MCPVSSKDLNVTGLFIEVNNAKLQNLSWHRFLWWNSCIVVILCFACWRFCVIYICWSAQINLNLMKSQFSYNFFFGLCFIFCFDLWAKEIFGCARNWCGRRSGASWSRCQKFQTWWQSCGYSWPSCECLSFLSTGFSLIFVPISQLFL